MTQPNEQRYTLDEARRIMSQRECDSYGHDLEQIRLGDGEVVRVVCSRCPAAFVPEVKQ